MRVLSVITDTTVAAPILRCLAFPSRASLLETFRDGAAHVDSAEIVLLDDSGIISSEIEICNIFLYY